MFSPLFFILLVTASLLYMYTPITFIIWLIISSNLAFIAPNNWDSICNLLLIFSNSTVPVFMPFSGFVFALQYMVFIFYIQQIFFSLISSTLLEIVISSIAVWENAYPPISSIFLSKTMSFAGFFFFASPQLFYLFLLLLYNYLYLHIYIQVSWKP